MSEAENIDEIISLELGYGTVLRNAREKKGLSLIDVCTELRLTEGVIYAIENQNFEQLPEPAYVCGYIRNYARYMEIDAKPLIDNFKQSMPLKSKLSSCNSVGQTLEKNQEKRTGFFLFFLILLLAVGGFFAWQLWENKLTNFFSTEIITSTKNNENSEETKTTSTTAELEISKLPQPPQAMAQTKLQVEKTEDVIQANADITTDKESETQIIAENINVQENTIIQSDEAEQFESTELVQVQAEETLPELTENQTLPAEEVIIEKKEVVEEKPVNIIKKLEFKFTKNSWISVKDGKNKSLIYDLIHKGEVLKLSGKSPVNVFLGDGTGVELTVDGEEFDFKEHINTKNIAKFIIE